MTNKPLAGRRAVITGASRGLGRGIAVALAKSGASVALLGRDLSQLEVTESAVKQFGVESRCFAADVTEEAQVARVEREVVDHFHGVDILINNAGVVLRKLVVETTLEEWNQVIQTNLTGAFLMCRAFLPHMKGRGYGRIINLTSIMSHISLPMRTAYAASKGGVLAMSRALALELAPEGITVVCISPGPFVTEMTEPLMDNPEVQRTFTSRVPLGRWGKPEEIGELAAYLCGDTASFITGSDILIDGGWCAQ
jgi:NAD(P)-dependent dehydrogenase (short-subunit alcohol dehydrogenase family)